MKLGRRVVPKKSGTGTARVVITGHVVDKEGNVVGDLYEIEMKNCAGTWKGQRPKRLGLRWLSE